MYCIYSKLKKRICAEHIRSAKDTATKPNFKKKLTFRKLKLSVRISND